jgi:hypothetical protein
LSYKRLLNIKKTTCAESRWKVAESVSAAEWILVLSCHGCRKDAGIEPGQKSQDEQASILQWRRLWEVWFCHQTNESWRDKLLFAAQLRVKYFHVLYLLVGEEVNLYFCTDKKGLLFVFK